jgi:hypothetical protein
MDWLLTVIGGWKQVRHVGGYSYQMSRWGRRRIVQEPGFKHYGDRDEHWLSTGHWSEEEVKGRFKRKDYIATPRRVVG